MILSDVDIKEALDRGLLLVDPFPKLEDIQPASLDVHLGNEFILLKRRDGCLSTRLNNDKHFETMKESTLVIPPHRLVLGKIFENVTLPLGIACQVSGKSSLGRLGLTVHQTAGFVDPGWSGNLTLELVNVTDWPIRVFSGDKIAQLVFFKLCTPAERAYNGKYQNATEAETSRSFIDYQGTIREPNVSVYPSDGASDGIQVSDST